MNKLSNLVNYRDPRSLGNQLREKRFSIFKNYIAKLPKPIRILDVGGTQLFWEVRGFHNDKDFQITILNLHKEESSYKNIDSVIGNACDLSEFMENEFDVVFSNSVIEHLYSYENQVLMAKETVRVGKYHFIQTPNRYFLIEPHFLLPLFQFFPQTIKLFILTKTKLSKGRKMDRELATNRIKELRLLSISELRKIYPNSSIYKEKFFGMNKSFVIHNFDKI